ncbi:MAG TPA: hypothetical protein VM328_09570, partial [Fimbriimonadaceae bacterium]|nr:hypothetical protein [Fimbriimonadaceae bacterium]
MLSAFIVCGQVLPSGVALPALQGEQFLTIEAGAHTADISRVVFTPDGKTMLSGGYDKVVRVWDSSRLAQGIIAQERVLRGRIDRGKEGQIYSLAVNGEGLVAIGGVQREIGSGGPSGPLPDIGGSTTVFLIRLIDYRTGAVRKVIPVKDSATISALAFSPLPGEQNILYSADNNTSSVNGRQSIVRRWNIQESRFTEVGRHRAPIYGLAVSPDGKSLAVGDEMGGLKLWKATGGLISEVSVKSAVKSVAFSRDGKYVAAGCGNGEVLVFDAANVKTGQQVDTFKGKGDIWGLDFAKDPTTLAVGSELRGSDAALSEILVFKIGGGAEPVKSLPLSNPWIYALAIAPTSDTVVVGGDGGFMHSWPLDDKAGRTIDGWGQHINRVRWSQDGTTVGFGRFDPINGAFSIAQASLVNPAGATWSQSGRQPAGTKLERNSAGTGYQITLAGRTLNLGLDQSAFGDRLTCVVPLPDGRYAIGSIYNLYIYDKDLRNKTALLGHQGGINDLALSPDGQWLASCSSDQTVRIWNLRSPVKQIGLRERGIEPTLSLFPAKEEQWVAWTPEGFFASSTGAERFIRMHRNPRTAREPAEAPDILRQYRDEYKRADVIAGLLKHGTVTAAHKAAQEDLRRQIIAQREREKAAIEARRRQQDEEQRKIAAEIAAKRAEEERLAREQKAAEAARARAEREQ